MKIRVTIFIFVLLLSILNVYSTATLSGTTNCPAFIQDTNFGTGGVLTVNSPYGITQDPRKDLIVLSAFDSEVNVFDLTGKFLRTYGSYGSSPGQFNIPMGISNHINGIYYIADTFNKRVVQVNSETDELETVRLNTELGYSRFTDVVQDSTGRLYIADLDNKRILVKDNIRDNSESGTRIFATLASVNNPGMLYSPLNLAIDSSNNLYVLGDSGEGLSAILKYDPDGNMIYEKQGFYDLVQGDTDLFEDDITSVALDSVENIYVADVTYQDGVIVGHSVRKFNSNFDYIGEFDSGNLGKFVYITELFVDHQDRLYVADAGDIQRFYCAESKDQVYQKPQDPTKGLLLADPTPNVGGNYVITGKVYDSSNNNIVHEADFDFSVELPPGTYKVFWAITSNGQTYTPISSVDKILVAGGTATAVGDFCRTISPVKEIVLEDCKTYYCSDGIKNWDEIGVDCGGGCGNACSTPNEETCDDGVMNQDESDVDCGGVCEPCVECFTDDDCDDGMCYEGSCIDEEEFYYYDSCETQGGVDWSGATLEDCNGEYTYDLDKPCCVGQDVALLEANFGAGEVYFLSRGPCLDDDKDGLGTSEIKVCDANSASSCTLVGDTRLQELGFTENTFDEDCTVLPQGVNPVPFFNLTSLLLSLGLILIYYRKKF